MFGRGVDKVSDYGLDKDPIRRWIKGTGVLNMHRSPLEPKLEFVRKGALTPNRSIPVPSPFVSMKDAVRGGGLS